MSKMFKGYKLRIYPTNKQKSIINNFINNYRFVYNWAIDLEYGALEDYKMKKTNRALISFYDLCSMYKDFRKSSDFNWLESFPLTTARNALKDAVLAFEMYYNHNNSGKPSYKSKKRSKRMFKTRPDRFLLRNGKIRFEGLDKSNYHSKDTDNIDLKFNPNFPSDTKYHEPVISIDKSGNYYVSFGIIVESKPLDIPKSEAIGIDLGVRQTITLSNGEIYNRPKDKINRLNARISHIQHHITRDINRRIIESNHTKTKYEDIPKSKRAMKREAKYHKLLDKRHNIKNNWYHETAKSIVNRNPEAIVMEHITTMSMHKNAKKISTGFSRNIDKSDFTWIRSIFEYKCKERDIPFILADKQYPSSQICSTCGNIQKMPLYKHKYICPVCGLKLDRDVNAAINLRNLYTSA